MKISTSIAVAALSVVPLFCNATCLGGVDLNGSWEFRFEEGKSAEEAFVADFVATDTMIVPGCFDMMPKWLMKKGTGLYRRVFELDRDVSAAWLIIDGVGLRAKFKIDGREIGVDEFPWSRVELATGPLKAGRHIIEAAVDNRIDIRTNRLFFPRYDFYSFGGFFHGLSLSFDNRILRVRTRDFEKGLVEIEAVNFSKTHFDATIVFDGVNKVDATFKSGRATVRVPKCKLWSPDSPNLHTVVVDGCAARFGVRDIRVDGTHILLNGKRLILKGVNRHESHPDQGAATSEELMLRDIQLLKSIGGNFIRGAHYPQAQRFLDLCDENGILVWEESLGWGNLATQMDREVRDPIFRKLQVEQTRLMVRNSFNHPSVIFFGFLNECQSSEEDVKSLVEELAAVIRAEDSGRLVTFAVNRLPNGVVGQEEDISAGCCDVISFNTYPGWIDRSDGPGDKESLARLIKSGPYGVDTIVACFERRYPGKPILIAEMGTCGLYGKRDPAGGAWSEEFQAEYFDDVLSAALSNTRLSGVTLWQFCDARSYHRRGPVRVKPLSTNLAGLFDGYRRPKLAVEVVRRHFKGK
jgi:beta-glucuronidase